MAASNGEARIDYDRPETLLPALDGADRLLLISTNDPTRALTQHTAVIDAAKRIRRSGLPFTMLRNNQYTEHYGPQISQAVVTGVLVGSAGSGRAATATHADRAVSRDEILWLRPWRSPSPQPLAAHVA